MAYTSKYITAREDVTLMAEANTPEHVEASVCLYVRNEHAHTFMTPAAARRLATQLLVAAEAVEEAALEAATLG